MLTDPKTFGLHLERGAVFMSAPVGSDGITDLYVVEVKLGTPAAAWR
jgi:hypothetical protein